MSTTAEHKTFMFAPPRLTAGDTSLVVAVVLAAATSSAALATGVPTLGGSRITMICDAAMFVRFGVTDPGAAVVATDYLIPANTEFSRWLVDEAFFRAISTPGGNLRYYRSSR